MTTATPPTRLRPVRGLLLSLTLASLLSGAAGCGRDNGSSGGSGGQPSNPASTDAGGGKKGPALNPNATVPPAAPDTEGGQK